MTLTENDIDIAARTLFGEARGESREGQIAVAWVIRNRATSPAWWGRGVAEVCQHPWQFSCWNASDPNRSKLLVCEETDAGAYDRLRAIVEGVLGGELTDPTGGATHYCVTGLRPAWRKDHQPCAVIGHHEFFKLGPSA